MAPAGIEWGTVVLVLISGLVLAFLWYFLGPIILKKSIKAAPGSLGERVAHQSAPFISALIVLVSLDQAINRMMLAPGFNAVVKLSIFTTVVWIAIRLAKKLRARAEEASKSTRNVRPTRKTQ